MRGQTIFTLLEQTRRFSREFSNKRQLTRLEQCGHTGASRVASALNRILNEQFSSADEAVFREIESRRRALNDLNSAVEFVDFGAGKPHLNLTDEDCFRGSKTSMSLSEACKSSKPEKWCRVLAALAMEAPDGAMVELGTNLGISGSYLLAGSRERQNSRLWTLEGDPIRAKTATQVFAALDFSSRVIVENVKFQIRFAPLLNELDPVSLVFVDGHHSESGTKDYFQKLLPHMHAEGLLIFDDINWSNGMKNAWQVIQNHPSVAVSVDLGVVGICILGSGSKFKARFDI